MTGRESIDIEALLIRAYYEKQVHRMGGGSGDARSCRALDRLIRLGAPAVPGGFNVADKVDTSPFAAKMAAHERELHGQIRLVTAPLLDLHERVLGLPDFYIEHGEGLDFVVWDAETAVKLGHRLTPGDLCEIVKLRRKGGRGEDRAMLVPAGKPRKLTRIVTSVVVITAAASPDRPDVPPVVVLRQRPVYEGARKEAVRHEPVYETPLRAVVEARAAYAVWHAALGMILAGFASPEYEVTGPRAPAEPWLDSPKIIPSDRDWSAHLVEEATPADAALARRKTRKVRPAAMA